MNQQDTKAGKLAQEIQELRDVIDTLRRRMAEHDKRLTRLEVRDELWEEPSAAGDEPIRG
jgi:hypothetical protein